MATKKIKFNSDLIINGAVRFEAGKVYEVEVETGSFQRWLKRGAEEVVELTEVKADSKVGNKKEEIKEVVLVAEEIPVVPVKKEDHKNKKNKDKIDL